jgi:hypothetical protein
MDADSLVTFVLEQTAKKSWDSETVLRIGVDVAMKVNQIKGLKGPEKKKLVLDVIQKAMLKCEEKEKVGKTDTSEVTTRWAALRTTVNTVLPVSLDLVVLAARGGFDFKKLTSRTWLQYCCCFLKSAADVLVAEHVIPVDAASALKKAEETLVVMVDLSGERQVLVAAVDLSGVPVDLSGVKVSLTPVPLLQSENVKEWSVPVVVASPESVVLPTVVEKEETPQSESKI